MIPRKKEMYQVRTDHRKEAAKQALKQVFPGVKDGRFPKAVKLGPRTTVWRVEEIRDLIRRFGSSR
jgi:hypothetical protein